MANNQIRVAHEPGFTDISKAVDQLHFITAGIGRELRIWEEVKDEDPISHALNDDVTAVACIEGRLLVGMENRVQALTYPDGDPDGVIFRFTAPVTCITASQDGKIIVAGSCDMTIKAQFADATRDVDFEGHKAPILSLAMDPNGKLIVSASCDGTLKAWDLDTGRCVKTVSVLPVSNDFGNSPIYCRLDWIKDGTLLAVPTLKNILVYETTSEENPFENSNAFSFQGWKGLPSIVKFSPSGAYLACATTLGEFTIFSMSGTAEFYYQSPKKLKVCGLIWNENEKELIHTDIKGNLGSVEVRFGGVKIANSEKITPKVAPRKQLVDDDDDGAISISKLKAEVGFQMTEEGDTFTGKRAAPASNEVDIDDILAMVNDDDVETESVVSTKREIVKRVEPARSIQPSFQSGSTPVHLTDRYMVYNHIGFIRSQNFEESILDIVFHDVTMHHNIHMSNTYGHTMADLNEQCCILAAESSSDQPGKVVVLQLNSWDQHPEWSVDLSDEEPVCVAAGATFVAVATDKRLLRLFTITGMQRGILTVPGPIVTLSGRDDKLCVVYHSSLGVNNDQALSFAVAEIPFQFIPPFWSESSQPLPLSPESTLQWIGFSDDCNPVIMDSVGLVQILYKNSWIPILDCKRRVPNKSDNYFIVGISEREQNIRAIFCKGTRYPAAHITPVVQLVSWQLPLCDLDTDKGQQEETLLRWSLVEQLLPEDSNEANQAVLKIKEGLMKLFALSTTADRDARAYSVAALMNTAHQVQLAAKYALRTQHRKLADKLHQLANQKLDEEAQAEDADLFATQNDKPSLTPEVAPVRAKVSDNPLLKAKSIEETPSSVVSGLTPLSLGKKNPFAKKAEKSTDSKLGVLDTITIKQNKPKEFGVLATDLQVPPKKAQKGKQMTLKDRFAGAKKASEADPKNVSVDETNSTENSQDVTQEAEASDPKEPPRLSGFALFLQENRALIIDEFPDSPEDEIAKIAVQKFRQLSPGEKAKYLNSNRKRKNSETDNSVDVQKKVKGIGKLKMFAREEED